MKKQIGKITSTMLGVEDHGIFSASLVMDYGGSGQSIGGFSLDEPFQINGRHAGRRGTAEGHEFIIRLMRACGVSRWEALPGRTIYVLHDVAEDAPLLGSSRVVGVENLPTEPGERFIFADAFPHTEAAA